MTISRPWLAGIRKLSFLFHIWIKNWPFSDPGRPGPRNRDFPNSPGLGPERVRSAVKLFWLNWLNWPPYSPPLGPDGPRGASGTGDFLPVWVLGACSGPVWKMFVFWRLSGTHFWSILPPKWSPKWNQNRRKIDPESNPTTIQPKRTKKQQKSTHVWVPCLIKVYKP